MPGGPEDVGAQEGAVVVLGPHRGIRRAPGAQAEREEGVVTLLGLHAGEQPHRVGRARERRGTEPLGGKTLAQGPAAVHAAPSCRRAPTAARAGHDVGGGAVRAVPARRLYQAVAGVCEGGGGVKPPTRDSGQYLSSARPTMLSTCTMPLLGLPEVGPGVAGAAAVVAHDPDPLRGHDHVEGDVARALALGEVALGRGPAVDGDPAVGVAAADAVARQAHDPLDEVALAEVDPEDRDETRGPGAPPASRTGGGWVPETRTRGCRRRRRCRRASRSSSSTARSTMIRSPGSMAGCMDVDATTKDWNRNPRTTTIPRTAVRRMAKVRRGRATSAEACSFRDASAVVGVQRGRGLILSRVCVLAQACPVVYAYRTSPGESEVFAGVLVTEVVTRRPPTEGLCEGARGRPGFPATRGPPWLTTGTTCCSEPSSRPPPAHHSSLWCWPRPASARRPGPRDVPGPPLPAGVPRHLDPHGVCRGPHLAHPPLGERREPAAPPASRCWPGRWRAWTLLSGGRGGTRARGGRLLGRDRGYGTR